MIDIRLISCQSVEQTEENFDRVLAMIDASAQPFNGVLLKSATEGSTKVFVVTVDDDGELTATEVNGSPEVQ